MLYMDPITFAWHYSGTTAMAQNAADIKDLWELNSSALSGWQRQTESPQVNLQSPAGHIAQLHS